MSLTWYPIVNNVVQASATSTYYMMLNGGAFTSIKPADVPKICTVYFKDGDKIIETKEVISASSVELTIGNYEKPGYILTGWKRADGTIYPYGYTIEKLLNNFDLTFASDFLLGRNPINVNGVLNPLITKALINALAPDTTV